MGRERRRGEEGSLRAFSISVGAGCSSARASRSRASSSRRVTESVQRRGDYIVERAQRARPPHRVSVEQTGKRASFSSAFLLIVARNARV